MAIPFLTSLCYTVLFAIFAFVCPAYQCYKASARGDLSDLRRWCCYWVVLATCLVLQFPLDIVFSWVPFYYLSKLAFTICLWHPRWRLAQPIYQKIISPMLLSLEPDIDEMIADSRVQVKETSRQLLEFIVALLQHIIEKASSLIIKRQRTVAAAAPHQPTYSQPQALGDNEGEGDYEHDEPDWVALRSVLTQEMQQLGAAVARENCLSPA